MKQLRHCQSMHMLRTYTYSCRPIVVVHVQVNETAMRLIVTDRERDYIFASDFDVLVQHLDNLINEACREFPTETPRDPTPFTRPPDRTDTPQFRHIFAALAGVRNNSAGYFVLLHGDRIRKLPSAYFLHIPMSCWNMLLCG